MPPIEFLRDAAPLQRLHTDHIGLYYMHRLDPDALIEETAVRLAGWCVKARSRAIGYCEIGPSLIRRAVNADLASSQRP